MKTMKKSVLALCLLGTPLVYGQTTTGSTYNSSSTSTTTNSSNTNMNSSNANMNTTSPYNTNSSTGSTSTGTGTYSSGNTGTSSYGTTGSPSSTTNGTYNTGTTGTMNGSTGTMNNGTMNNGTTGATNSYDNTTTTTTTTSSDYNGTAGANRATRKADGTRDWGKSGKFGVYAGLNFSRFANEPIVDNSYRTGWQAGIYGRSGGTLFGQIGLEYRNSTSNLVRSGSAIGNPTTTTATTGAEVRDQINQHFLAIPAYVGARIGSLAGLRLQAGAELSSQVAIGYKNFDLGTDDINRTILNGLLGAGINLGPVTLDAVYNHGLSNVFDNADTKRRMWQFNVGFRF
jgi:hypothetical protein